MLGMFGFGLVNILLHVDFVVLRLGFLLLGLLLFLLRFLALLVLPFPAFARWALSLPLCTSGMVMWRW